MNIQWYPGHMTKAKRAMKEDIKLIDLVIELVDARVPFSSRNPDIDELAAGKARMVLLNKADLADPGENARWAALFEAQKIHVVTVDARNKGSLKQVQSVVQEACKEKLERDRRRGILNRPIRTMVVGIPNVGKSTFINSFAGKACAKTGNKPGVTKGNQWIRLNKTLELLDTPGILWPRFEDQKVGLNLALIGSINDQILNKDELACQLIGFLKQQYPGLLAERYGVEEQPGEESALENGRAYEREYDSCAFICGVDEAGRGPLAGPVAAGAVILPKDCRILYLNDSKKLSPKRRQELFEEIKEKAIAWNVGLASPERIDEINILQATYEAMAAAIRGLKVTPQVLLNDAVTIPGIDLPQVSIVKGDAKSVSIAAASILAKVTRDRMMEEYDSLYPEYGFGKHKGYGTAAHIQAIKEYGPCPIHRLTFIKKFI